MTITFTAVTSGTSMGAGAGKIRLRSSGTDSALPVGASSIRLRSAGYGESSSAIAAPVAPASGLAKLRMRSTGTGTRMTIGAGGAGLQLVGSGQDGDGGRAALQLRSWGFDTPAAYGLVLGAPPITGGYGAMEFRRIDEAAAGATLNAHVLTAVITEMVGAASHLQARADGRLAISESGLAGDVLSTILQLVVTERAAAADVLVAMQTAVVRALEQALASTTLAMTLHFTAVVQETALAADAVTVGAEMLTTIMEHAAAVATLSLDTGDYVAWVLNTDSKGVSRYTNYPFNSFARVGGKYYGCSSTGIYDLEGDDDDGAAIAARVRFGMHDMGTRKLKRVPEAYIGYTSNGTLLLSVITSDETTGDRNQAIYTLEPRAAASVRENRWKIGRGFKSVDWDFVITNADGADFDLQSIAFHPLILDRRTRG